MSVQRENSALIAVTWLLTLEIKLIFYAAFSAFLHARGEVSVG